MPYYWRSQSESPLHEDLKSHTDVFCFLLLITYFLYIPELCSSFGLMQRMYDGSLFIRITISWLRLFLNCVTAVSGRFFVVTSLAGNTSCWKEYNHTEKQNYFHAVICGYHMSVFMEYDTSAAPYTHFKFNRSYKYNS